MKKSLLILFLFCFSFFGLFSSGVLSVHAEYDISTNERLYMELEKDILPHISGGVAPYEESIKLLHPELMELLAKYHAETLHTLSTIQHLEDTHLIEVLFPVGTDVSTLALELKSIEYVLHATPAKPQMLELLPDDPYIHSRGSWWPFNAYDDQWGIQKIHAPEAWDITTGESNVIVAVIDTGIEKEHPDLQNRLWKNTKEIPGNRVDDDNNGYIDDTEGWNFVSSNGNVQDDNGHGTHIAGIIGAATNNGTGMAGLNWKSPLMILKVFDKNGAGNSLTTAQAIKYAVDNGAKIINLSLAGESTKSSNGKPSYDEQMLAYAYQRGVSIITAAGNQGRDIEQISPANYSYTIAVSASEPFDTAASFFSNFGKKIDVSAPGLDILSTFAPKGTMVQEEALQSQLFDGVAYMPLLENKKYAVLQGTSMSSAFVTGVSSLLLSVYPQMTPETLRTVLRLSAEDIGEAGFDIQTGMGRVDAKRAFDIAEHIIKTGSVVTFLQPEEKSLLYGSADIVASFSSEIPLSSWKLQVKNQKGWETLTKGENPMGTMRLTTLDSTSYPEGELLLKILVERSDGKVIETQRMFFVEHIRLTAGQEFFVKDQEHLLLGQSVLPLTGASATWKQGAKESEVGVSVKFTTFGFLVSIQPQDSIKVGLPIELFIRLKTPKGELVKKITKKVVAKNKEYSFMDVKKTCSMDLACIKTPENSFMIEVGPENKKVLVMSNHAEIYLIDDAGKLLPGWPKKLQSTLSHNPIFVELDRENKKVGALVVIDNSGVLHAFGLDGGELSPLDGTLVNASGGAYVSAADVNQDGKIEFIIAGGQKGGKIGVLSQEGKYFSGWPLKSSFALNRAPALGDLNGDGVLDMLFSDEKGALYALDMIGKNIEGWPKVVEGTIRDIMLTNTQGDEKVEVVIVSQYADAQKQPKVRVTQFFGNGRPIPAVEQEFTGVVGKTGALRKIDSDMFALALSKMGKSGESKMVFLRTDGKVLAQVPNTEGNLLWSSMQGVRSPSGSTGVLVRNETQALLITSAQKKPIILGALPPLQSLTQMSDAPLCGGVKQCIPVFITSLPEGLEVRSFALEQPFEAYGMLGYNHGRNYNTEISMSPGSKVFQRVSSQRTSSISPEDITLGSSSKKEKPYALFANASKTPPLPEVYLSHQALPTATKGTFLLSASTLPPNFRLVLRLQGERIPLSILQQKTYLDGSSDLLLQYPEITKSGEGEVVLITSMGESLIHPLKIQNNMSPQVTLIKRNEISRPGLLPIELSIPGEYTQDSVLLEVSSKTYVTRYQRKVLFGHVEAHVYFPKPGTYTLTLYSLEGALIGSLPYEVKI